MREAVHVPIAALALGACLYVWCSCLCMCVLVACKGASGEWVVELALCMLQEG